MNKELFDTQWKLLANNKKLNSTHFIQRAIIKAMNAKNKTNMPLEDLVVILLQKHFTPTTNTVKLANGANKYQAIENFIRYFKWNKSKILDLPIEKILDQDEFKLYETLATTIKVAKLHRRYVYYFTAQEGLTPEQQGVQSGHVLFALGAALGKANHNFDPNSVYFQWIGVKDQAELLSIIGKHKKLNYVTFKEPDLGNVLTSIAFYPILWNERDEFMEYNLLTH